MFWQESGDFDGQLCDHNFSDIIVNQNKLWIVFASWLQLSWHLGQLCDQREESRGGFELRPRFVYIYLDRHGAKKKVIGIWIWLRSRDEKFWREILRRCGQERISLMEKRGIFRENITSFWSKSSPMEKWGISRENFTSFWSRILPMEKRGILVFTNEDCRRRSHTRSLAKIRLSKQEKSLDLSLSNWKIYKPNKT